MRKKFFRKDIVIVVIALSLTIMPTLCISTVKADSQQMLLKDDFTKDTSLNMTLWTIKGSVAQNIATNGGDSLVDPALSFSATGMTMGGTTQDHQVAGVQATSYYTPPFTITVTVESIIAHGNAFVVYLTTSDYQHQLTIKGNTDSANGGYYGLRVQTTAHISDDQTLYASPSQNIWYTFQMIVDANGMGSAVVSTGNTVLGNLTNFNVGMGPFFLILGQHEGVPYAAGPNVAIWQSIEILNGTNQPPGTPQTPSGPTSGYAEDTLNFTTSTRDPNDNQVYYEWNWGDGTLSSWLGPYPSGDVTSASHQWPTGNYSVEAKAKNTLGLESDWSDPLPVHIVSNQYPLISNPTPENNADNIPITTSSLSVLIQDRESDHFNWNITTSPNIGSSSSTSASNGTKTCAVTHLTNATTYTWTVSVYDGIHWANQTYIFTTKGKGTPGFELVVVLGAIAVAMLLWKKKRRT